MPRHPYGIPYAQRAAAEAAMGVPPSRIQNRNPPAQPGTVVFRSRGYYTITVQDSQGNYSAAGGTFNTAQALANQLTALRQQGLTVVGGSWYGQNAGPETDSEMRAAYPLIAAQLAVPQSGQSSGQPAKSVIAIAAGAPFLAAGIPNPVTDD